MQMKVMLDEGAFMPVRAHEFDAGLDILSPVETMILPRSSTTIDSGVHLQIAHGYTGFLKSKSGLNMKHDITTEGVVDSEYTGSIRVKMYNNGDDLFYIRRGDKITQIVILPVALPELVLADSFEETSRGNNGFGSTGR